MIHFGDAKENTIEANSVDLIFTDPIYARLEDYAWLADEAMRVLKDDRPLLVWGSMKQLHKYIPFFENAGLTHMYNLSYVVVAKTHRLIGHGNLFLWNTPCMWFNKGKFKLIKSIPDTKISQMAPPKGSHKWNKNEGVIRNWMESFSNEGDTVVDFFAGHGIVPIVAKKLKRECIAYEEDWPTFCNAQGIYKSVEPDLFEQMQSIEWF